MSHVPAGDINPASGYQTCQVLLEVTGMVLAGGGQRGGAGGQAAELTPPYGTLPHTGLASHTAIIKWPRGPAKQQDWNGQSWDKIATPQRGVHAPACSNTAANDIGDSRPFKPGFHRRLSEYRYRSHARVRTPAPSRSRAMNGSRFTSVFGPDLESFLSFKESRGHSGKTRPGYLKSLDRYCTDHSLQNLDRSTLKDALLSGCRAGRIPAERGCHTSWTSALGAHQR